MSHSLKLYMQDKNDKLARENNSLKSVITQRMKTQEDLLKRSIKAEYNQILTYRQMLEVLEHSVTSLEGALEQCKRIQQSVLKNRKFLADKTNSQTLDGFKSIKDTIEECRIPELETENKINIKKHKQKPLVSEKDIDSLNLRNNKKRRRRTNVQEDLFESWEKNEIK